MKRLVAAVARQEAAGNYDEACPGHGQADDQVPRRRRLVQVVWKVVPEPVLQVVHEDEEGNREQRGRDPDHGAQQHEADVAPYAELGLRLLAHYDPDTGVVKRPGGVS